VRKGGGTIGDGIKEKEENEGEVVAIVEGIYT